MPKLEKPELVSVSSKGQVVIPQAIRQKLGLKAKSQLLAYGFDDGVVLKIVHIPNPVRELKRIWRSVDRRVKQHGLRRLDEHEIAEEIERYRRAKGLLE
jgi:AbrB family looped-hinge helix DNA binding protein